MRKAAGCRNIRASRSRSPIAASTAGAPGLKIGPMIVSLSGCTSTGPWPNSALGLKRPNDASHQDRHQRRAAEQQAGLDDLHPGGGDHAAEGDIEDHQHTDDDDGIHVSMPNKILITRQRRPSARSGRTATVTSVRRPPAPGSASARSGTRRRRRKVYRPRLRSGSAIRKVTIGQPTASRPNRLTRHNPRA